MPIRLHLHILKFSCNFAAEKRNEYRDKYRLFLMPLDKNKARRFQVLDRCFADQYRKYFVEDLQSACRKALEEAGMEHPDVSRRTILNDIAEMEYNRDWNVELLPSEQSRDGKRRFYRYANPNFSIWKLDLNEEQLLQLKSVLLMLRQFRNFPQYEMIENIVSQLEKKYRFSLGQTDGIVAFEANDNIEAMNHIGILFSAIANKQVLHILYQPFGKSTREYVVCPYYLKQYNCRWFLFAQTIGCQSNSISNFALDRIVHIEFTTGKYIDSDIDFTEYFDDIIGVTNSDEPAERIVLAFTPSRFPYVISKPLHPSQKITDRDKCQISIEVKPTKELYQHLLSFGADVEVLSPESVRQKMYEEIEKMIQRYSPMQKPCTE